MHNNCLWCKWGHPSAATNVAIYPLSLQGLSYGIKSPATCSLHIAQTWGCQAEYWDFKDSGEDKRWTLVGRCWHMFLPNNINGVCKVSVHTKVNRALFSNRTQDRCYLSTDLLLAQFFNRSSACAGSQALGLDAPQHIASLMGSLLFLAGASHFMALAGREDGTPGEQHKPQCCLPSLSRCHVLLCFISLKTNVCLYACSSHDELRVKMRGDG